MKILIVEDNFVNRKILTKYLSAYGEADIAVDGKEALDAFIAAHKAHEPYQLICLDIMMPNVDGRQTLDFIRKYEEENRIFNDNAVKILMTTALGDKENIIDAFISQCDEYIIKPIRKEDLFKKLDRIGIKVDYNN